MQEKSTINLQEVEKFSTFAGDWWEETSKTAKMLHRLNPLRLEYITNYIDVKGKKVLDVGCGGGILCMPLARLEANVYAIEPSLNLIEVARQKAQEEGLKINFYNTSLEEFEEEGFDAVFIMDAIEHVQNPQKLLLDAVKKLNSGGLLFISTINNNLLARFFVRFMAEDIIKIIPQGTHDANKFVSPSFIKSTLTQAKLLNITGFKYSFLSQKFSFTKNTLMNYFMVLQKI